ncbi:MAG TPA: hypothetical protein VF549_08300 [Solirubrobacteraceae bacterium]|jgi:hypothetical protein
MSRRDLALGHSVVWGTTALAAAAVALAPGAAAQARRVFGFRLDAPVDGSWSHAAAYFVTNTRALLGLLLLAWLRPRSGPLRRSADAVFAAIVGANTALVGACIGAYGGDALPCLAHLPFEWSAIAVVAGAYASGARESVRRGELMPAVIAGGLLLAAAAIVESFISTVR